MNPNILVNNFDLWLMYVPCNDDYLSLVNFTALNFLYFDKLNIVNSCFTKNNIFFSRVNGKITW